MNTLMNRAGKKNIKLMIIINSTMVMLGIYISSYQYLVLSISQAFNFDYSTMGLLIAIQYIGMVVPPLFLGMLCNKIGTKIVLIISYFLIIIGTLLAGISQTHLVFMFSVFLIGAGFSVTEATLSAVLTDEFTNESTRYLNFSQAAFCVGAVLGPFIAELLIKKGVYFKSLFICFSLAFLILAISFIFNKYENNAKRSALKGFKEVIKTLNNKTFLLLIIAIFLYVGIENTVASFTDSYYKMYLNAPEMSAVALSLFWGSMIPSRILAGIIKINHQKLFLFLSSLVFISFITAMMIPNSYIKTILFAICGFGCGPLWPLIMDQAAQKSEGLTAFALNIMMSFAGLGGAMLPFVSGILVNAFNPSIAYYLCSVAVVLMAVLYLLSIKKKLKRNNFNEE